MTRIAATELPTPITAYQSVYGSAPVAPAPTVNGRRRLALIAAAGLAALGIGGYVAHANGNGSSTGHTTIAPRTSDSVTPNGNGSNGNGSAGNTRLSADELDSAYQAVLGVRPTSDTISCLDSEIGDNGAVIAKFVKGELLSADQAGAVFTPFATCAPDNDFLGLMLPITMDALQQQADQTCISDDLLSLGVADRAGALQLAYSNADQRANAFFTFFQSCVF